MKKFLCFVLVLCMLVTTAYAAPFGIGYLKTSRFNMSGIKLVADINNISIEYSPQSDNKVSDSDILNTNINKTEPTVDNSLPEKPNTLSQVVSGLCVITGKAKMLYNEQVVTRLTYYKDNTDNEYFCFVSDDSRVYAGSMDISDVNVGSLCYLNVTKGAMVNRYVVISVIDEKTNLPVFDKEAFTKTYNSSKLNLVYTNILKSYTNRDYVLIEGGNEQMLVISDNTNLYTINFKRKSTDVISGDCFGAKICDAYYDDENDTYTSYPVFAIEYDGECVFVCSYATPVILSGDIP